MADDIFDLGPHPIHRGLGVRAERLAAFEGTTEWSATALFITAGPGTEIRPR
jgi:hypothetical protein